MSCRCDGTVHMNGASQVCLERIVGGNPTAGARFFRHQSGMPAATQFRETLCAQPATDDLSAEIGDLSDRHLRPKVTTPEFARVEKVL